MKKIRCHVVGCKRDATHKVLFSSAHPHDTSYLCAECVGANAPDERWPLSNEEHGAHLAEVERIAARVA